MGIRIVLNKGYKCGEWTTLEDRGDKNIRDRILCRCSCGTERNVLIDHLTGGNSKSCGCLRSLNSRTNRGFAAGDQINWWTVMQNYPEVKTGGAVRLISVRCYCGKEREHDAATLLNNKSRSCGCRNQMKVHFSRKQRITS